ncbi:MAG: amino acid permease [Halobacteriales archaeon]|nr:amino acid permease [Halobacteriales archaeon]
MPGDLGDFGGDAPRHDHAPGGTQVRLARDLTLADATLLGVGALMGGGIFIMPGIAAAVSGPAVWLALALNAIVTIPTLLVYAELASAYHDAGGGYLWIKDALREPFGFLGGWMSWFSHAVACAVYALASGAYLVFLLQYAGWAGPDTPAITLKLAALGITAFFVLLNYRGVKAAARTENAVTSIVLVVLAIFLVFGTLALFKHPEAAVQRLHLGDWQGMLPFGFTGVFLTMGLTFIAFEGYEIIAQASEEVRRPKRNVPLACILSVVIMAPLLVWVAILSIGAVQSPDGGESWAWLASKGEVGLVAAAGQFIPFGVGAVIVLVGAMLSNVTALNSTIYSSSRVSFAMARDNVLPRVFARVNPRSQAPDASIVFSGLLIAAMAALLPIEAVAAAADIMFLMLFFMVNVSYIKLRKTTKHMDYGFRAPFFPYLSIVGIAAQVALAVALYLYSPVSWLAAAAWVGVGLAVHYGYARRLSPAPEPRTEKAFDIHAAERRGYSVLLPVANPATLGSLAAVASDIARAKGGDVLLLHVVTVPRATLPSAARHFAEPAKPFMRDAARQFPRDVPVHTVIKIAHDPAKAILETAEEEGTDLILLGWRGRPSLREHVLGSTLDPVVREAPCDVAVYRESRSGSPRRVVLAARGRGKHAKLGAELAGALAKARGTDLVALTVITPSGAVEPEARLASVVADAGIGPWEAQFKTVRAASAEAGLLQAAQPGDLLLIGASDEPAWHRQLFGTLPERVAARAEGAVLLVKRSSPRQRMVVRGVNKLAQAVEYLKPEQVQKPKP